MVQENPELKDLELSYTLFLGLYQPPHVISYQIDLGSSEFSMTQSFDSGFFWPWPLDLGWVGMNHVCLKEEVSMGP